MKTKIAINGFGRIGRSAFKIAHEREDVEVVAINDLGDVPTFAHLLKHDSNYGIYHHEVEARDDRIVVDGQEVRFCSEPDPAQLPWADMGVSVVIESTGRFVNPEDARKHLEAGAKKVVISAPAKGEGATTMVLGVNDQELETASDILSNASCTTNCITPPAAVIDSCFGVEKAMMTTIHSYTADQQLQDGPHKDLRRARSAPQNIVPTTTGAALAASQALPQLQGVFDGMAVRVPTPVGSLSDFTFLLKRDVTEEEVNEAFRQAAQNPIYEGILAITDEPLVSSDFVGNSYSSIVDLSFTKVVGGNLLKVVAWYDNEWGYSNRLVELVARAGSLVAGKDGEV